MDSLDKSAPTTAIVAALSTLACCVPLGFLGGVGVAGIAVWAQQFRRWFALAIGVQIAPGLTQSSRSPRIANHSGWLVGNTSPELPIG